MLSFTRIYSKIFIETSELRFIFGQDLSEASWKCFSFFKNSEQENMSVLDQRHKPP